MSFSRNNRRLSLGSLQICLEVCAAHRYMNLDCVVLFLFSQLLHYFKLVIKLFGPVFLVGPKTDFSPLTIREYRRASGFFLLLIECL